jgi:formamidopyrimidine-DNA glycosylase
VESIHTAMQVVLQGAIEILRERVGEAIHIEVRDFLGVHGKPGQPCPRCGTSISQVAKARRATQFCRTCQPGLMLSGRDRRLRR